LARQIASYGETLPGLEQYAVKKFATALETFAKTLAENTGVKANEVISKLFAAHEEGKKNHGFDIDVRILIYTLLPKFILQHSSL
jgi:T-complex protein 1 subunit theta